jgi:hypothetical protein
VLRDEQGQAPSNALGTAFRNAVFKPIRIGLGQAISKSLSPDPPDWKIVAEHDIVATVTDGLKPAPVHLGDERIISDKPFDIPDLAFHHTAFLRFARRQHLGQPEFGRQVIG